MYLQGPLHFYCLAYCVSCGGELGLQTYWRCCHRLGVLILRAATCVLGPIVHLLVHEHTHIVLGLVRRPNQCAVVDGPLWFSSKVQRGQREDKLLCVGIHSEGLVC